MGARMELARELDQLARLIEGHNQPNPALLEKAVIVVQLRAARDLVRRNGAKSVLAKWALPVLVFLAGAFAEGAIGAVAERCLDRLSAILAG